MRPQKALDRKGPEPPTPGVPPIHNHTGATLPLTAVTLPSLLGPKGQNTKDKVMVSAFTDIRLSTPDGLEQQLSRFLDSEPLQLLSTPKAFYVALPITICHIISYNCDLFQCSFNSFKNNNVNEC